MTSGDTLCAAPGTIPLVQWPQTEELSEGKFFVSGNMFKNQTEPVAGASMNLIVRGNPVGEAIEELTTFVTRRSTTIVSSKEGTQDSE